jgi:hypothetical protein
MNKVNTAYTQYKSQRPANKKTAPVSARAVSSSAALMRKAGNCACGGGCPRCNGKEKLPLQTKLNVSQPGDALEREADQVAEQVLRMPSASTNTSTDAAPQVSRMASSTESSRSATPAVHDTLSASGQPLDATTRQFFEPRFGHDFSHVRVHADTQAAASAQSVDARAYTVGSKVVFNTGEYAPHSPSGQRLLAHELTHVVQQSQGSGRALQRAPQTPGECDPNDLGTLGEPGMFVKPEADVQAMGLTAKYVTRNATPPADFVLYCPHKSTRPLKKLVPCSKLYWIGDAEKPVLKGKGKDEVWAKMEGETELVWGYVKKSYIQNTPCAPMLPQGPASPDSGTNQPADEPESEDLAPEAVPEEKPTAPEIYSGKKMRITALNNDGWATVKPGYTIFKGGEPFFLPHFLKVKVVRPHSFHTGYYLIEVEEGRYKG